jgi:hypothetical protein
MITFWLSLFKDFDRRYLHLSTGFEAVEFILNAFSIYRYTLEQSSHSSASAVGVKQTPGC